jgi:hypothetical protein
MRKNNEEKHRREEEPGKRAPERDEETNGEKETKPWLRSRLNAWGFC